MNDNVTLAVEDFIKSRGLPLKVIKKADSFLMKVIGFILKPFNKRFMTSYVTVIPFLGRIYVPDTVSGRSLSHEGMHLEQARQDGQLMFALKYLFPQSLAPLALLAIGAIWWLPMLWSLLFLTFLAPLPAPWRVRYEREAYRITAAYDFLEGIDIQSVWYNKYMLDHYGWDYYKMAWREKSIKPLLVYDMEYAKVMATQPPAVSDSVPYDIGVVDAIKKAMKNAV